MQSTAIILLNFNSFQDTNECIESILDSRESHYTIVVVDNASKDNSLSKLKGRYASNITISFIDSNKNLGFSGGCNLGIEYALQNRFDYILLLNNDTIVTPGYLSELKQIFKIDSQIGIVGGKTLFNDDRKSIWDAGGSISKKEYRGIRRRDGDAGINTVGEVGFVTCCLALVKREVIEKIGPLPEAYFFGSEEWDFSLRAQRAGFKLMYTPECVIYHKVGRSHDHTSLKMMYNTLRNRLLFTKRNFSKSEYYWFKFKFLGGKLLLRVFNRGQFKEYSLKEAYLLVRQVWNDSRIYNYVSFDHIKSNSALNK